MQNGKATMNKRKTHFQTTEDILQTLLPSSVSFDCIILFLYTRRFLNVVVSRK